MAIQPGFDRVHAEIDQEFGEFRETNFSIARENSEGVICKTGTKQGKLTR
jgi:hypothetical protein